MNTQDEHEVLMRFPNHPFGMVSCCARTRLQADTIQQAGSMLPCAGRPGLHTLPTHLLYELFEADKHPERRTSLPAIPAVLDILDN